MRLIQSAIWIAVCLGLGFSLVGCQPKPDTLTSHAEYAVFGTRVEVSVRHAPSQSMDTALAELDQRFQTLHRDWHPWAPGALTTLNQALATRAWVELDPALTELLERSQALEVLTDGYFNAAIGQLVGLWGFHTSHYPITTPPPSQEAVAALVALKPSTQHIEWRENERNQLEVRTDNPAIGLDFSGIAKGAAAGMACDLLEEAGFTDALINLGGDVMVCGESTQPWRVAIKDPRAGVLEVLEINERLAVFTSGQYYRYGEWAGERYAHVLDPATGYPITHILQATAIHKDPMVADAAATALVVAGTEKAQRLGEQLGLERWLLVDEAGKSQWMKP